MAIPILSDIEKLINQHASAVVLKEHLSLLNTKLSLLLEDIVNLQKEKAYLVKRNAELEEIISRQEEGKKLIEHQGALFELLPSGAYSETPRCPECRRTMSCLHNFFSYKCSNRECGHAADFKGSDLQRVIDSLPKP